MLKNIELFNVANVKETPLGYALERYPESVLSQMNEWGSVVATYSDGCELRFVPMGKNVRITVMAENGNGNVTVMRGDRTQNVYFLNRGVFTNIDISESPYNKIENRDFLKNDIYSCDVVRLIFSGARFILSTVESFGRPTRTPKKEELPKFTALAYGSSVTQGSNAITSNLNYISTASHLLNTQTLNKGLGGSCFMENAVADWFETINYDYMIYEAGTNMAKDFTPKEIEERGIYMLDKLFSKNPDKYIFLITPMIPMLKNENPDKYKEVSDAVIRMHKNIKTDKCVLIDFTKLQTDTTFVTTDFIHPSTESHVMMGLNLSKILKPYIL